MANHKFDRPAFGRSFFWDVRKNALPAVESYVRIEMASLGHERLITGRNRSAIFRRELSDLRVPVRGVRATLIPPVRIRALKYAGARSSDASEASMNVASDSRMWVDRSALTEKVYFPTPVCVCVCASWHSISFFENVSECTLLCNFFFHLRPFSVPSVCFPLVRQTEGMSWNQMSALFSSRGLTLCISRVDANFYDMYVWNRSMCVKNVFSVVFLIALNNHYC